jgi:hypothetical protein
MLKQKHNGSSSSAAEPSLTLSKSEKKLALNWNANIANANQPAELLQRYAKEKDGHGAVILAHALNLVISTSINKKQMHCTLLYSTTAKAIYAANAHIRQAAIETIKELLKYGAKVRTEGPCPILLLLNADEFESAERIQRKFPSILAPFLEYPETFEIRGEYDANIAHLFARHSCGCLPLILKKRRDLLNTKQSNGRTILAVAIEKNQTKNALMLINDFRADLSLIVNNPQRALSLAIFLGNLPVTQALLRRGAPIETQANSMIPDNQDLIWELANAGYFLCNNHTNIFKDKLQNLSNMREAIQKTCFFTLESEDGKQSEQIFNEIELLTTKIVPSPEQIKRLHLTFLELISANAELESKATAKLGIDSFDPFLDENFKIESLGIDAEKWACPEVIDYIYMTHLQLLYDAFKIKFPLRELLQFIPPEAPHSQDEIHGPDRIQAYIYTGSLHRTNHSFLEHLDESAKKVLRSPLTTEIKIDDLMKVIHRFHQAIMVMLTNYFDHTQENIAFKQFAFKMQYRFATKIIPIFLRLANTAQLDKMADALLMISSLACNHFDEDTKDSSLRMIELLESIRMTYSKHDLHQLEKTFLMLSHIVKFKMFAENYLYDALKETLGSMNSILTIVLKESTRDSFQKMLSVSFDTLIKRMSFTMSEITDQAEIIDLIESMVNELIKKGATRKSWFQETLGLCKNAKSDIQGVYRKLALDLKGHSAGIFELGDFNGKAIKLSVALSSEAPIDIKLLRARLKKIDQIEYSNGVHYFHVEGLSQEKIDQTILALKSLTLEEVKAQAADESTPISPSSATSDEGVPQGVITSEVKAEKQVIKKQKNKVPSQPVSQMGGPSSLRVTQEMFNEVKAGLKTALDLREDADLFPIDHPGFRESRKHLCFGLWSDISSKKPGTLTDEILESHHDLARTGKVATFAYGQNGLKPNKVIDASTGKYVEGLKTKRVSDDLRINSAPVKVKINSKEEVLLFVFGVATDHKQDAPKIDTAAIIAKSCNQK